MELRVTVCGSGGVGKTALCHRIYCGRFLERYDPTIEDTFEVGRTVAGRGLRVHIHDTAGQEEYRALTDTFLKDTEGVLVVYAITSRSSLAGVERFVGRMEEIDADLPEARPLVIFGNKADLDDMRELGEMEMRMAYGERYPLWEGSAREGNGVQEALDQLLELTLRWKEEHPGVLGCGGRQARTRRHSIGVKKRRTTMALEDEDGALPGTARHPRRCVLF